MDSKHLASLIADNVEICEEADPAMDASSQFAQTAPGVQNQMPNPLSPIMEDADFFTYLMPGAVFEAHDGSQWLHAVRSVRKENNHNFTENFQFLLVE